MIKSGKSLNLCCPNFLQVNVVDLGGIIETYYKGYSGCCEQEHLDRIYRKSIHPIKRVIVVFSNGLLLEQ